MSPALRILVVRRDNIGDLVCTTPLLRALRRRFPDAWIGALVNRYNAAVLDRNPDVSEVFAYQKLKHREPGESLLGNIASRFRLVAELRRRSIDWILLAGNSAHGARFARLLGARHIVGYAGERARHDVSIEVPEDLSHEVEITFRLASAFDIGGPPPAPAIFPDPARVTRLRGEIAARHPAVSRWTGLHISARKPSQRWPIERFAELARGIASTAAEGLLLFWSPGAGTDPRHPGDDDKAATLARKLRELPLVSVATPDLAQLVAGLSLCDRVVCADGGAMHVAAALGIPMVCLFGNSDASRWRPWGVPHILLQNAARDVRGISTAEVFEALETMRPEVVDPGRRAD